jgi:hypothetical protein
MGKTLPLITLGLACLSLQLVHAQCDSSAIVPIYSTDFEADDGGFVESGGGDWEYGVIPDTIAGLNCGSSHESPGGAHSGTKGWGTLLNDCYQNLGAFSGTGITVDLSDPALAAAQLKFAQWFDVFVNFDYMRITANGTEIYRNDTLEDSGTWRVDSVDLGSFLGQASVTLVFDLYATTVVNRAGWYIDDVSVTGCTGTPSGIADLDPQPVRVWPVPASEMLHIDASALHSAVTGWSLYDATGRVLATGNPGNGRHFSVDVADFHGVAVLDLLTGQGHLRHTVVLE